MRNISNRAYNYGLVGSSRLVEVSCKWCRVSCLLHSNCALCTMALLLLCLVPRLCATLVYSLVPKGCMVWEHLVPFFVARGGGGMPPDPSSRYVLIQLG